MDNETRIVIEDNTKRSIPILGIITVILVSARVSGLIDLAWVWIFAPLWAPSAIVLGTVIIGVALMIILGAGGVVIVAIGGIVGAIGRKIRNRRRKNVWRI